MKIAVITANLGEFDPTIEYVEQSLPYDFYRFTDVNFPPRHKSMTPLLQARIVKMFGWQMVPGYDYYIWVDSSCILSDKDSVKWFLEQCEGVDMAVFKHPERDTIQQEADFLKERLQRNDPYIVSRYENELVDEQLAEIKTDADFADKNLFASTAFVYKNNPKVQGVMFNWWYHTSRYHSIDQLSLPYVLFKQNCAIRIIPDSYLKIPYLKHIRKFKDQEAWEAEKQAMKVEEQGKIIENLAEELKKVELQVDNIEKTIVKFEKPVEEVQKTAEVVEKTEEIESKEIQLQDGLVETLELPKIEEKIQQQDVAIENYENGDEYQSEINFWRRWLEGNGKAYERSGRLSDRFTFMIGDKKEVMIANLGAGAMSIIGNYRRDVNVKVTSSDLLADDYTNLRAELNLNPQHVVEKQDMENLTYEDSAFDIVYCANALDHTKDPYKALKEMLRVCKPGGYIYLRHIAHEGKRHLYRNLHKWNIDATENGDCKFWSNAPDFQNKGFLLSDIYHGFKTTVELIPKGALITSFVQKG